jgi:hypothetical protein
VGSSARCELALKADGKAGGEQGVLELARSGDDSAFGALVGPYRAELHAHCYRMLGSEHDAEDALQDVLLRAWKGLPGFEGRSSVRSRRSARSSPSGCSRSRTGMARSRRPISPDSACLPNCPPENSVVAAWRAVHHSP